MTDLGTTTPHDARRARDFHRRTDISRAALSVFLTSYGRNSAFADVRHSVCGWPLSAGLC